MRGAGCPFGGLAAARVLLRGGPARQRRGGAQHAAATLVSCTPRPGGGAVRLQWADGHSAEFDARWLRLACGSARTGSHGQRCLFPSSPEVRSAAVTEAEVGWAELVVRYQSGHASRLSGEWLRRHAHDPATLAADRRRLDPLAPGSRELPQVAWSDLESEEGVWRWVQALNSPGACLVRGVPCEAETVLRAAERIGPVMRTLYPIVFDVQVEERPINIAYTTDGLAPHQDLPYYESPPGVQLLHCLEFSAACTGGESLLLDSHAAAELLRQRHPEHFAVLARVPATFQKDHVDRENPAQYWYSRPHISVNGAGDVLAVFWSPPFEGELRVPEADVPLYFDAYAAFADIIDSPDTMKQYGWTFRLNPGDLIAFNNRRILHGRRAIGGSGPRHLQGCYVSTDDFANRFRNLARRFAPAPAAGDSTGVHGARGGQQRWGFQCNR
eukprot:TRINITY_DN55188_c0_g1_i1.p1 TRINITY_DN55188_c0_g1~~TRINITY_DN55188_c0_g1_i1.p1  ORF type:complete len:442 (+),score=115.70 TRINITY_DN55188_c0_g1_i1:87-1412(+)